MSITAANNRLVDAAPDMLAALNKILSPEVFHVAVNRVELSNERLTNLIGEIYEIARIAANQASAH